MSELMNATSACVKKVGEAIKPYFSVVVPNIKEDGSWVTEADTIAHDMLLRDLPQIIDLPVLSEELSDAEQQRIITESKQGYWCVDPLDGTSNFTQGIAYWCISVGLVLENKVKLGIVFDANRNELFSAEDDQPSCINGEVLNSNSMHSISDATALVDLKRLPKELALKLILDSPQRSQRNFGASALDLCWIAADRCQVYLHGQQKLWDYVAGNKILLNAGGCSETFDGEALFQNNLTPQTVIAATNSSLMNQWRNYFNTIQS